MTDQSRAIPPASVPPAQGAPVLVRQGDVLVMTTESIPPNSTLVRGDRGRIVLAFGEATGHAHAIRSSGAVLLEAGTDRYIRASRRFVIEHEEHGAIELPAGEYRVVLQREYVPDAVASRAWRWAAD